MDFSGDINAQLCATVKFAKAESAYDVLRAKLLPQVYSLGFLNPDVEYFK